MTAVERCSIIVNGVRHDGDVEVRTTLADHLRGALGLTGTHLGCEQGSCGSCTVLLDGEPVRSCLILAAQADGREVRTIEGLACDGRLSPLQEACREVLAFQCGFCTPGFLMTLTAALAEWSEPPTRGEIREALAGNLCRCTGYQSIVDAVALAVERTLDEQTS